MSDFDAAWYWASRGVPVFPLAPGTKRPFSRSVQERRRCGLADATTDPEQIRRWRDWWPAANVGGRLDGQIVIDLDTYKLASEHTRAGRGTTEADWDWLPATWEHRTASGGRHLFYRDPVAEGTPCRSKLDWWADVKAGPRAYVLLPPSCVDGRPYEIARRLARPDAPPDLLEVVRRAPVNEEALPDLPDPVPVRVLAPREARALADPGTATRSEHTYNLVCQAVRSQRSNGQVLWLLLQDAITCERWDERPHLRWWEPPRLIARARADIAGVTADTDTRLTS